MLPVPTDRLERNALILKGPFQPTLDKYPVKSCGKSKRSFIKEWFKTYSWLEYSIEKDSCFCFFCRIFPHENSGKSGHSDAAFTQKGFDNWKRGIEAFRKHQNSRFHLNARESYNVYLRQKGVDECLDKQQSMALKKKEDLRQKNRAIISRLIDVVKVLSKGGKPFRGHSEREDSQEKGLFLELVNLLAKYDPLLKNHIETGPKNALYLSNKIQNDLISAQHNVIFRKLKVKLRGKQITLIADETSDVGHHEQLSVVVRYEDNGVPVETIVGVYRITKTDAETIFTKICEVVVSLGLTWGQIDAVCFDGANTMSGSQNGVQARCKRMNPRMLFVHCYAHCLNLVLVDAVTCKKDNTTAIDFFGVIQCLYAFIEGSPSRHAIFEKVVARCGSQLKTLKTLSTTRWAARAEAVTAISEQLDEIVQTLREIVATTNSPDVKLKGKSILRQLSSFGFLVALNTLEPILQQILTVSKALQGEHVNFSTSMKAVELLKSSLISMKSNDFFGSVYKNTVATCSRMNIKGPEPHGDSEQDYWNTFFLPLIEALVAGIDSRFEQRSTQILRCLEKTILLGATDEETNTAAKFLNIPPADLRAELSLLKMKDKTNKNPQTILTALDQSGEAEIFPNYRKLLCQFIIYPVSSCSAERAFSKLTIIKTKLRSTMTQQRLNALMMPFIEQKIANEIDNESIIDEFNKLNDTVRRIYL